MKCLWPSEDLYTILGSLDTIQGIKIVICKLLILSLSNLFFQRLIQGYLPPKKNITGFVFTLLHGLVLK